MNLIIGGYAQGKLNYVLQKYGLEAGSVWDGVMPTEDVLLSGKTVIINHFHNYIKACIGVGGCPEQEVTAWLERCQDCIIISDEIGNGIVPIDAQEREYRERTGRILVELAGKAEEVVRVICGQGQKIK